MLTRSALARIGGYLLVGFVVWVWLSQLGTESVRDANEAAAIRQVEHVLATHDAWTRRQDSLMRSAAQLMGQAAHFKTLADREGVARVNAQARLDAYLLTGDTAAALAEAREALTAAEEQVTMLDGAYAQCVGAFHIVAMVGKSCMQHADSLTQLLDVTKDLLTSRRTFRLAFVTLPRPTKWQAALGGALLGGLLDRKDPLRGATAGGLGAVLLVPTR